MMNIQEKRDAIMLHYYEVEGGAVDNADDLGGMTGNGGITKVLLDRYERLWEAHGYTGESMSNIPYSLIKEIYILEFWNACRLDDICAINPDLAEIIYGWALNSGRGAPVKMLQKFLSVMNKKGTLYANLKVDGGLGNNTLIGLRAYLDAYRHKNGMDKLKEVMLSGQTIGYIDISWERPEEKNETFTDGWLNRVLEKRERVMDDEEEHY